MKKETSSCGGGGGHEIYPGNSWEVTDDDENYKKNFDGDDDSALFVDIPPSRNKWFDWRKLWLFTGPGFLMSIAYLDPGNIESDLQSGAIAHYKLIWVLLASHVIGLLLQRMSARLGVVAGKDMAEVAYEYYPRPARLLLWIMVEIAIIGSDMQEVIGTAISLFLLTNGNLPLWAGVLLTMCDTLSFMFLERFGVRKFEAFFCFLIACMAATFGYEFVISKPVASDLFTGMFVPWAFSYSPDEILQGVSVVGAVIMPHNLYLHSALVKSRRVKREDAEEVSEANKYFFIESAIALVCSFIINVFVVGVFARTFFGHTNQEVYDTCLNPNNGMPDFYRQVFETNDDAAESDIYHAGVFLGCTFGVGTLYVWAIGILAAGQSSTMTGTYAGQFVMEGFIKLRLPRWKRILITRTLAIAPTLIVTIFSKGIDHLSGMNDLLNCIMMLQLPFAVLPMLTFASDRRVMGRFRASLALKIASVAISLLVIAINAYFVYQYVSVNFGFTAGSIAVIVVIGTPYSLFVLYLFTYSLVGLGIFSPREDNRWLPPPNYSSLKLPADLCHSCEQLFPSA